MDHYPRPGRPLSVLVVDPASDAATSTAELLALYGFDCRTAGCGEEAVAAATETPPDVVLAELLLDGMDGCELACRLRDLPGEKRPLLVALTVCGREEDRRRTTAAGFDMHLVKPADPAVLVGLLGRFHRVLAKSPGCTGWCPGCQKSGG